MYKNKLGGHMGKKSRKERKQRQRIKTKAQSKRLKEIQLAQESSRCGAETEVLFQRALTAVRKVMRKYVRLDAAVAIGVSDLWPQNVASPVKHIFAWAVLLGMESDSENAEGIATYETFSRFALELYEAWPDFPVLEDFAPEADWGQVKILLGDSYVPMFYGSSIERSPDFVQAFRITHAGSEAALADMDLALAMQADLIRSVSVPGGRHLPEPDNGYIELPPKSFWAPCRSALLEMGARIQGWRSKASDCLIASFGAYQAPLTVDSFGNAIMAGRVLPFLGVTQGSQWIPLALRSGPGVAMDYWAEVAPDGVPAQTHRALARFIAERFRGVFLGPMTLVIGSQEFSDLPISCAALGASGIYLFCACDYKAFEAASRAAQSIYAALKTGGHIHLRLADGRGLGMRTSEEQRPDADNVRVLIVITHSGSAFNYIDAPKLPARAIPLADLVSVFDALEDFEELERFWTFADEQCNTLSIFSRALSDLFAAFKDSHGILVYGAIKPTVITLDPNFGSGWRFRFLTEFWAAAPERFPDQSIGWRVSRTSNGVTELRSRDYIARAYSTQVGPCTFQATITIARDLAMKDGEMIDMFAQMLIDALNDCASSLANEEFFQRRQIVLGCHLADSSGIDPEQLPSPLARFERVVVSVAGGFEMLPIKLMVNAEAVQAGLYKAIDASFQARCLRETLEICHSVCGMTLSSGLASRLELLASRPARFHLQVVARLVDVPDYAEPVITSQTEYKLARKALAVSMREIGLEPGRYDLGDAKARMDAARDRLRLHIEERLASLNYSQLVNACIEQHDALLVLERMKESRVRQSQLHEVDYDRLDAVSDARKELGTAARNYRYLLEKTVSVVASGQEAVNDRILRELIGLIDWYMVLAGASDVLHNEVDIGGIEIDDSFVPEVFFSVSSAAREKEFARETAKLKLGIGVEDADCVEGDTKELLADHELRNAFRCDLGFELQQLLQALIVLSQPVRHGLADRLAMRYSCTAERAAQMLVDSINELTASDAAAIIAFLTLSGPAIRRLPGKSVDETDVPFWEHKKRLHRYAIRPLIVVGNKVSWGAEHASRSFRIWMTSVRDGFLPGEFAWPNIVRVVRKIKESIEQALEVRTEVIFRRHTPYVKRGFDFFRRYRSLEFEDVGDFDMLAYWPETNTLVFAECKYNQPAFSVKDSRRLRDRIFGQNDSDQAGQISKIRRRREFLAQNRHRILELLTWPISEQAGAKDFEVYVSRDLHYWMVHPPYEVPTQFIRIDAVEDWIKSEL